MENTREITIVCVHRMLNYFRNKSLHSEMIPAYCQTSYRDVAVGPTCVQWSRRWRPTALLFSCDPT
ncbi:hypothetical protein CA85_31450 [Allorhodopirellula solitaria]|uniref:Uncharacterized protein n=1 Tax=Allorhodopirellula solitaria TaxID=2527987 RepID=A0A5C5XS79_9BACT|nr:hypothetical protein CA85_31450 [Allorhodopirellula solitaria]